MRQRSNLYLLSARRADPSVVAELELLLREARSGSLQGFVIGCMHLGTDVSANVVGACRAAPVIGAGLATLIAHEIEKLI